MSCLPAKKRLTFELFGFERKPQVDRNIAWGFCPSGTSRMLNKRLTFELFGFERKPQVDRNIAWGFCPSGTSRMLNARQPQAPNAILYLLIFPAMFTFKCRNAARKIKTPPSFLTEAFNLSGNIYPSCNPHSLFKPKKRVSSSAMPGSHLRVVWVSPTDKYPSSHNG